MTKILNLLALIVGCFVVLLMFIGIIDDRTDG